MKLNIRNFQSIASADLTFNGFSVIVGKSDMGKSATRRAVASVLFNNWDKSYRRLNSKSTEVALEYNNTKVSYQKDTTTNSFTINGNTLPKMGKERPDLPTFREDLNITTQLESLYMVSYKDAENTKILNNLFGIDIIEQAQSLCASDMRKQKIECNLLTEQHEEAKAKLRPLQEYEAKLSTLVTQLESLLLSLSATEDYLSTQEALQAKNTALRDLQLSLRHLTEKEAYFESLTALQAYLNQLHSLSQLKAKIAHLPSANIDATPLKHYHTLKSYLNTLTSLQTLQSNPLLKIDFTKVAGIGALLKYFTLLHTRLPDTAPLDRELVSINTELASLVCPTCGKPLD